MKVAQSLIASGVIEVRADGTVWKLKNLNAMPLPSPRRLETKSTRGYLLVRVNHAGKGYLLAAHRLVWTALRNPIPEGMDINHKDGIRTNNHPDNLEVVTRGENHRHAYRKAKTPLPESKKADARQLRAKGLSYSEIARRLGISQTAAYMAVTAPKPSAPSSSSTTAAAGKRRQSTNR